MRIRSILPALCIVIVACGKKAGVPAELIQPPKMQWVLWDFIHADALTTQLQKSNSSPEALTANVKLQKQIFAIHRVTKAEFYKSLEYYKSHPALMKILMDSILTKANRERQNSTGIINPLLVK